MIFLRFFALLFFVLNFAIFSLSAVEGQPSSSMTGIRPVEAHLLAENESIQPGHSVWVAVRLKIADDWHAYWKNPGGIGFPTSIAWELPSGFATSDIHWPIPEKIVLPVGINYGYTKDLWLLTEIKIPEELPLGENITMKANIRWLVCSDTICLPGDESISLSLPVSLNSPQSNSTWSSEFVEARNKIPKKPDDLQVQLKDDTIELAFPFTENTDDVLAVYFCPELPDMIDETREVEWKKLADQCIVTLKPSDKSIEALKGTLVLQKKGHSLAFDIEAPIQDDGLLAFADFRELPKKSANLPSFIPAPVKSEFEGGFGLALVFAFLGGCLLNLMPCVLPVISLKIFSFVKMSGESRLLIFKHGLSFSLGVLVSFWLLASLLLILQAYGHSVGWGFQLQEPLFVAALAAVLLIFSMSFFGVFELGTLFASWAGQTQSNSRHHALLGSFFSGVLATAVATPCTGPFLGSAVGFAVTLSAPLALVIFTALGLGMAFPYLLLSAYPALIKFLPKPGAWMVTFKELMGFFMLGTALWLVWVFGAQTSLLAVFAMLAGFLSISFGCWVYGKWGNPMRSRSVRVIGIVVALIFCAVGGYAVVSAARFAPDPMESSEIASAVAVGGEVNKYSLRDWEPFSLARLHDLQAKNIPVLIDFTAKWCLICQTNHLILSLQEVSDKLEEMGVVKMQADWTKNDPVITEELKKFGRNGVPLYVLYGTNPAEAPFILPQVLTPDIVLDYLKKISDNQETVKE